MGPCGEPHIDTDSLSLAELGLRADRGLRGVSLSTEPFFTTRLTS